MNKYSRTLSLELGRNDYFFVSLNKFLINNLFIDSSCIKRTSERSKLFIEASLFRGGNMIVSKLLNDSVRFV